MKLPVTYPVTNCVIRIPESNLASIIGQRSVEAGEKRFEMEYVGPWSVCKAITGLANEVTWSDGPEVTPHVTACTFHGNRTMNRPKPSGYAMEGKVAINGNKRRAFTSSVMFQIQETGKLVEVACLYVCKD